MLNILDANQSAVLYPRSCIPGPGYARSYFGRTPATVEARHLSVQRAGIEHPLRLFVTTSWTQ
jgi:hypothetical protein